jgi:hypothetical protein
MSIRKASESGDRVGASPVYAAGVRRGCTITQISISSGRILVGQTGACDTTVASHGDRHRLR